MHDPNTYTIKMKVEEIDYRISSIERKLDTILARDSQVDAYWRQSQLYREVSHPARIKESIATLKKTLSDTNYHSRPLIFDVGDEFTFTPELKEEIENAAKPYSRPDPIIETPGADLRPPVRIDFRETEVPGTFKIVAPGSEHVEILPSSIRTSRITVQNRRRKIVHRLLRKD